MKIELIEGERNTKSEEVVCMSEKALICDNVCKHFVEKNKAVNKINFQFGQMGRRGRI